MNQEADIVTSNRETIADLRELYRAAEGRAARIRLISETERALAGADGESLSEVLGECGQRLAFFLGFKKAVLLNADDTGGLPLTAPGPYGDIVGRMSIGNLDSIDPIADPEDREAARIQLDLMGAAIDRVHREREKADLLAALQDRERSLERLVERIFTAQEEERRRVSHELHDGVAQTATALVRLLESAQIGAESRQGGACVAKPAEIARGLVSELRRVIAGLRPTLLDDLGLVPALHSLADGLEADRCKVTRVLDNDETRLPPLVETALFRVAQEAVSNIRKHASVPCDVSIEAHLAPGSERILRITDHGKGSAAMLSSKPPAPGSQVGIDVMRERMAGIGGSLMWKPGENGGVVVEARLPGD
ncbi:sensor histidine kinase [Erythrobacter rubeus]|uniref:histidine kinase n=1 Tax=Erythrobacter rubeus TaxID=2760803 RepID=A0ABR8KP90_9SPHN|nr:histidine kinase [Erythrobacter rubeus]MBD2840813.1 histidine kinase [Erythrobacter rubeus]